MKRLLVKESLNESRFDTFMTSLTSEFRRSGMSERDIHLLSNDPDLIKAVEISMEEDPDLSGMEYARMLLNQWSGVPKYPMEEGLLGFRKKSSKSSASINDIVNLIDRIEHFREISRDEAIELVETHMNLIRELISDRGYSVREVYNELERKNII
jgi:hypothetical protein